MIDFLHKALNYKEKGMIGKPVYIKTKHFHSTKVTTSKVERQGIDQKIRAASFMEKRMHIQNIYIATNQ